MKQHKPIILYGIYAAANQQVQKWDAKRTPILQQFCCLEKDTR